MFDLHNVIKASRGISPAAASITDAPFVSQVLDTANFARHEFLILIGALADADATFTVLVEESDAANMSGAIAVADADLVGTELEAGFTFAADDTVKKIGYKGAKRYVRATITPANNTGNVFLAGVWVQAGARKQPVA